MQHIIYWFSLILIFIIPWENSLTIKGLGTIGKATGLIVGTYWAATVLIKGKFRKLTPFHFAMLLFVLWNMMSLYWTQSITLTMDRVITYIQLSIFVWIVWDLFSTPETLRAGMQAYILGAYVSIVSLIINYYSGIYIHTTYRFSASGFNENALALLLALGIPVAWYLAISGEKGKILRLINYLYLPAAMLSILLTASRGGFIATFPALLYVLVSFGKIKIFSRIVLLFLLIAILISLYPLVPESSIARLGTIGQSLAQGDVGERADLWQEALHIFLENPITGVGSNSHTVVAKSGRVTHNTFLALLSEVGIIGFSLFMVILAIIFYFAIKQPKLEARLWLAVLLVWFLDVNTFAWEYRKATWLFFSLVTVSAYLPKKTNTSELKPT